MFYLHNTLAEKYCQEFFTKKFRIFWIFMWIYSLFIIWHSPVIHDLFIIKREVEKKVNISVSILNFFLKIFTVFTVVILPQHKPKVEAKALILKGFRELSQFSHQQQYLSKKHPQEFFLRVLCDFYSCTPQMEQTRIVVGESSTHLFSYLGCSS